MTGHPGDPGDPGHPDDLVGRILDQAARTPDATALAIHTPIGTIVSAAATLPRPLATSRYSSSGMAAEPAQKAAAAAPQDAVTKPGTRSSATGSRADSPAPRCSQMIAKMSRTPSRSCVQGGAK